MPRLIYLWRILIANSVPSDLRCASSAGFGRKLRDNVVGIAVASSVPKLGGGDERKSRANYQCGVPITKLPGSLSLGATGTSPAASSVPIATP